MALEFAGTHAAGSHNAFRRCALVAAGAACLIALAPSGAAASRAGAAQTGGANIVIPPVVKQAKCVKSCARKKSIRGGSLLRLTGTNLSNVKTVIFTGSRGAADDVRASVQKATSKKLTLRVPAAAPSGAVVVEAADGTRSKPSLFVKILPPPPVIGTPDLQPLRGVSVLASGAGTIETGTSTPRKVFLGSKQLVRYSLRVSGVSDVRAIVTLVRPGDGATIQQWSLPAPDGQIVSVNWNGLAGGQPQGNGRYAFRLALETPAGGRIAATASVTDPDRDAFDLYGYIFPIRGKHDFGMGAGRFGDDRGSHRHQGQDVFARCGTRLVAARGGVVQFSGRQSAAGNYIVIDTDYSDVDMAYMHLRSPSPFRKGDRVYTGQTIGQVGDTGRASGCHLHFEQWTGPGWYEGGKPFDPLPDLLAWDAVS